MKENFKKALAYVLAHEGGYVNHKKDPGGATNRGVTRRVYDAYRRRKGQGQRSVRHITDAEVHDIYKRQYWDRVEGDELPSGVDYAVFDYAVNSGTGQAEKEVQRVVGVKVDGQIGQVTLAAIESRDPTYIINKLCDRRLGFMQRIRHRRTGARLWDTFKRGWSKRVAGVRKHALEMVEIKPPERLPDDPGPVTPDKPKGLAAAILAFLGAVIERFRRG